MNCCALRACLPGSSQALTRSAADYAEFWFGSYLGGVSPSALYSAMQGGLDKDSALPDGATVEAILSSWVDRPGYPVVNVIRNYETDSATVTQVTASPLIPKQNLPFIPKFAVRWLEIRGSKIIPGTKEGMFRN